MNHPFVYVGCFLKFDTFHTAISCIRKAPLENIVLNPHVTFMYKPDEVILPLFGEKIQVTAIGYGNDGNNEGLKVRLKANNPIIQSMISKIEVPHITIAVSGDGKPVNTKNLCFEVIDPIELEGEYGGYAKCGEIILESRNG